MTKDRKTIGIKRPPIHFKRSQAGIQPLQKQLDGPLIHLLARHQWVGAPNSRSFQ